MTIEDNLELGFDRFPELHRDVVALEERRANIEGQGAISLADEVRWALRMDPDRVIVGEVRGDEFLPMLNAISHGNDGSMCTIHANSSKGIFEKLALYALQPPSGSIARRPICSSRNSIHFAIFLDRDREGRYVSSIREITGAEGLSVQTNEVFAPAWTAGPCRPAGARMTDRRVTELMEAGFDPEWLDAAGSGSREWRDDACRPTGVGVRCAPRA